VHVRLQPGAAQALAGAVGERRDGVRLQPEQGGDLGGGELLELGVPEHVGPLLRERGVGAAEQPGLGEPGARVVRLGDPAGVVEPVELVQRDGGCGAAGPAGRDVADGDVEVRAERALRPVAGVDGLEDARERLLDQVVRVEPLRDPACRLPAGPGVPSPELAVGVRIPGAHEPQEVAVGLLGRAQHHGSHLLGDVRPIRRDADTLGA
jgi:hypothetical protein